MDARGAQREEKRVSPLIPRYDLPEGLGGVIQIVGGQVRLSQQFENTKVIRGQRPRFLELLENWRHIIHVGAGVEKTLQHSDLERVYCQHLLIGGRGRFVIST